jgi:hypothetical protein
MADQLDVVGKNSFSIRQGSGEQTDRSVRRSIEDVTLRRTLYIKK